MKVMITEVHPSCSWIDLLNRQVKAFSELAGDNKKAYEMACEKNNDLCARIQVVESMRDHYKTIMTEALRDRDLHARTADNWQAKLVRVNEEVLQLSDICKYLLKYLDLLDEQKKAKK